MHRFILLRFLYFGADRNPSLAGQKEMTLGLRLVPFNEITLKTPNWHTIATLADEGVLKSRCLQWWLTVAMHLEQPVVLQMRNFPGFLSLIELKGHTLRLLLHG